MWSSFSLLTFKEEPCVSVQDTVNRHNGVHLY